MTAQAAFQSWLMIWAAVGGAVCALALGIAVLFVVLPWPRNRDYE